MVFEGRRVRRRRRPGGGLVRGGRLMLVPRAVLTLGRSTRRHLQLPLLGLYLQRPHRPPAPLRLLVLPPLLPALVHVLLVDERLDHLHSLAELLCFTTTLTLSGRSTTADELKNGACIGAELELSARIFIGHQVRSIIRVPGHLSSLHRPAAAILAAGGERAQPPV